MSVVNPLVFWGTLIFLVACDPSGKAGANSSVPDPETVFSLLEERLVQSHETNFEFHVTAEGAKEVDLQGSLSMGPGEEVKLTAFGEFAGEEVDLRLASDGTSYEFGSLPSLSSGPTPRQLKEALLIGFTRMGILHNLAMFSAGAPPGRNGLPGARWRWPAHPPTADGQVPGWGNAGVGAIPVGENPALNHSPEIKATSLAS